MGIKAAALAAAVRPAARLPSGHAAWAPVPNGGETQGRPPHQAPAHQISPADQRRTTT
ncbi:hypothetical protein [Sphaerisporangium corydalis]|uniref:Uncharacterized protein n=1 Tax=Sphaerisporangium corydalis TaxID=1441875 RepID=A0ABV9ELJ0_9ACTN|nr:hypothetical protein [Sphaerisporangium corydalis]